MCVKIKLKLHMFLFWKVGAPAEMASLLEEMSREKHPLPTSSTCTSHNIGTDPQLDDFMVKNIIIYIRS